MCTSSDIITVSNPPFPPQLNLDDLPVWGKYACALTYLCDFCKILLSSVHAQIKSSGVLVFNIHIGFQ